MPTATLLIEERLRLHIDMNVNQDKFRNIAVLDSSIKKNLIKYYNLEFLEIKAKLDSLFINFKYKCNEFVSLETDNNEYYKQNLILLLFSSFNIFSFDVHYWIETYITTIKSYKDFLNISVYNESLFTKTQIDEIIKLLNKLNFFLFKTVSKDILDCCQLLIKIAYEKQLEYASSQTEKIDNFFNLIDYLGANI